MIFQLNNCTILDGGVAKRNNTVYVCLKVQQVGSDQPIVWGVPKIKTSSNMFFPCVCNNGGTFLESQCYLNPNEYLLAIPQAEAAKYNDPVYHINLTYLCQ